MNVCDECARPTRNGNRDADNKLLCTPCRDESNRWEAQQNKDAQVEAEALALDITDYNRSEVTE